MIHATNIDIIVSTVPVLVVTVLFSILIVARIYTTSLPVDDSQRIDPDSVGLDGLS
jgi:hypothetical protein